MLIWQFFSRLADGEKLSTLDMIEFTFDLFLEIVLWSAMVFILILTFNTYL